MLEFPLCQRFDCSTAPVSGSCVDATLGYCLCITHVLHGSSTLRLLFIAFSWCVFKLQTPCYILCLSVGGGGIFHSYISPERV